MAEEKAAAYIPSKYGDFIMKVYTDKSDEFKEHIAFVHKDLDPSKAIPVRIHSECMTGDLFGSSRCDCGEQFAKSLAIINKDKGIMIYLRQEGRGIGLVNKLKAYNLQDKGMNTIDANLHLGLASDARVYDIAIDILEAHGVNKIKLITNNPEKIKAIESSQISIVDRIPIVIEGHAQNQSYLNTKKTLMGHLY